MPNVDTPLLEPIAAPIRLRSVIKKASQKAFVSDVPVLICKLLGWTSERDLLIASSVAVVVNLIFVGSLVFMDYSALIALLGIKLKISENTNIVIKISVILSKLLLDFINAMGAAYSEIKKAQDDERERNRSQNRHDQAIRNHEEVIRNQKEIMAALSQQLGVAPTGNLNGIVRDFKQSLFQEHRAVIISEISKVVLDQTKNLHVMERYDLENQVTPRELKQLPLSDL